MDGPRVFRMLAGYNRWMNERLYSLCAELSDGERKRDRKAFFRSIHGSLNHVLLADRSWLGRFTGTEFPIRSLDQELYADFEDLRRERAVTDAAIEEFCTGLDEDSFGGERSSTGHSPANATATPSSPLSCTSSTTKPITAAR